MSKSNYASCLRDYECASDFCKPGDFECRARSVGDPCYKDSHCPSGTACNATLKRCAYSFSSFSSYPTCYADKDCRDAEFCDTASNYCLSRRGEGASCSSLSKYTRVECEDGLSCVGGTCAPVCRYSSDCPYKSFKTATCAGAYIANGVYACEYYEASSYSSSSAGYVLWWTISLVVFGAVAIAVAIAVLCMCRRRQKAGQIVNAQPRQVIYAQTAVPVASPVPSPAGMAAPAASQGHNAPPPAYYQPQPYTNPGGKS